MQKKVVVIRHLYDEDNVEIPEDTSSTVTEVKETFDVNDVNITEIDIPEAKDPEVKAEQQVRIWTYFDIHDYFIIESLEYF